VNLEPVNPPELAPPSGFAHAMVASGGRLVFLAGQTALDSCGAIAGRDLVSQFERALANLLTALRAAGGGPEHLASVTIYVTDLKRYRREARAIGAAWRRLAGPRYPAMAAVEVSRLWDEAAVVEIQGFAVVP